MQNIGNNSLNNLTTFHKVIIFNWRCRKLDLIK